MENKTKKQMIGELGEKEAVVFLKNKGYKILETNLKGKGFEIDIIARKQNVIYFFEVKTSFFLQPTGRFYKKLFPLEHINKQKIDSLYKGVRYFFKQKKLNIEKDPWKIIFLGIVLSEKRRPKIEMIPFN